jgi:hypothetical protein
MTLSSLVPQALGMIKEQSSLQIASDDGASSRLYRCLTDGSPVETNRCEEWSVSFFTC